MTIGANEKANFHLTNYPSEENILRAEGLLNVDETIQGGFADQSCTLARLHARLALQRSQKPQCAQGWPGGVVAGVEGPG